MKLKEGIPLKRGIYKWELVLLLINSIIGAGIFGLPSKIFALSGIYSLLAFVVCAVVIMVFILCFAEVSSQFDKTGGPYIYALSAFGPLPAFLMGWLLILNRIFIYATLINLLLIYFSYFSALFQDALNRILFILVVTALLGYINHRGIKNATITSNILTVAKLLPLSLFIVAGLFFIEPTTMDQPATFEVSSFTTSVLLLVFAFGGFESILINSGEIDRPKRNLPFALITSAIIVAVYYCLIQLVAIGTLPGLATSERPLAEAAQGFLGPWGGKLIAIGALVSILATLNAVFLSASRLPFALSLENQLPKPFSFVHSRYRTPTISLIAMGVAIIVVSWVWSFITALTISSMIRVLIYLIVCASLLKLRKQKKEQDYFKLRYGRFLAFSGIAFSTWLLTASKMNEIIAISFSIGIGMILYLLINMFKKKYKERDTPEVGLTPKGLQT